MKSAWISGVGSTPFGRLEGQSALDLMAAAAHHAIKSAGIQRRDVDGVLCGYATTMPHLMLATLFCERFALEPSYAHGVQMGGATGAHSACSSSSLAAISRPGRCP